MTQSISIQAMPIQASWEMLNNHQMRLSGALTRECVPDLWDSLQTWQPQSATCDVQLQEVRQVDSAGVALLIHLIKLSKEYGCHLQFIAMPQQLKTLVELSHLNDTLKAHINTPL